MNHKTTGILVIIFVALGLYVYFFETNPGNQEEATTPDIEKAFDFNIDDVREIILSNNSRRVLLQKDDGQWKIKQPGEFNVDPKKIADLLAYFDYGIVRVIDENPPDISLYGLDRPRYTVEIKVSGDDASQALIIGDDAPGNLSSYGSVRGQSRVLLLGVRYRQEFDRVIKEFLQAADERKGE